MPASVHSTVVIPCYNESQRLDFTAIQDFLSSNHAASLLMVDDGSTDDTLDVLRQLQQTAPNRIEILALAENCGKAEAVRRGMLAADQMSTDYVGFWDADMATPLSAVPHFSSVLDRCPAVQIVWGTRLGLMGRHIQRQQTRRLLGRVFSKASAIAVGLPIHDALCGAKMFRSGPWLRAFFGCPFDSRWIFDVEILSRLKAALRQLPELSAPDLLFEFPLDEWSEIEGSRLTSRDFIRAGSQLATLLVKTRLLRRESASVTQMIQSLQDTLSISPDTHDARPSATSKTRKAA